MTKEYWINIESKEMDKPLKENQKKIDEKFKEMTDNRIKDCIVIDKPTEKLTIKYLPRDNLYKLFNEYEQSKEDITKNYFSYRSVFYKKDDIEDYIKTIELNFDNKYINFEIYNKFKKVEKYNINRKDPFSKADIEMVDPDTFTKLNFIFKELETLKEFISLHYINIPESIKDKKLPETDISDKINKYSILPKVNKNKTQKWGNLCFSDKPSLEPISENILPTTEGNLFETKQETVLDPIIIDNKIDEYNTDSNIKINYDPDSYWDSKTCIVKYRNLKIVNGKVYVKKTKNNYEIKYVIDSSVPFCMTRLIKEKLVGESDQTICVISDKNKYVLDCIFVEEFDSEIIENKPFVNKVIEMELPQI